MWDCWNVGENVGVYWFIGECFEGCGIDEVQGGFGGNDLDVMIGFGELMNNCVCFVGGDVFGDIDYYLFGDLFMVYYFRFVLLFVFGVFEQIGVDFV